MKTTLHINYYTKWGENLAVAINDAIYPMEWTGDGNWSVTLDIDSNNLNEYIYMVIKDGLVVKNEWESHSRKDIYSQIYDEWIECPVPGCPFRRKHTNSNFDQPGFRGAGTAIPVFSLRSKKDFGIGEFKDLHYVTDWAEATGQCIIQLLPINDTIRDGSWKDSYPYSPVSVYALHPMYVNLQDIGVEEDSNFLKIQEELNSFPEVDYPRVFQEKMKILKTSFLKFKERDKEKYDYRTFIKENDYWLKEYSAFAGKRDNIDPEFHIWLQYHLDKQLMTEVRYARSKGISFKGDLPIGVSADSVDAYYHPELFNLDCTAGAPPDFFSRDGQNWGFPTYNWDEMAKDNYRWWRKRLKNMSRYFDAYRIDHILGFFRIWEIPAEYKSGMLGHFNPALPYTPTEILAMGLPSRKLFHEDPRNKGKYQPFITADTEDLSDWQKERFQAVHDDFFFRRHNEFWRMNAERKLPSLLSASGMLACGEDLGMVPDCVPEVMASHGILSLKVRGMEDGKWDSLSVAATSSHDISTLRMQFEEDPEPGTIENILKYFLNSPSMLAIFPIQDWIAIDKTNRRKERNEERINDPSNPNHHWRYRFHIPMEELTSDRFKKTNETIQNLIKNGGRFL